MTTPAELKQAHLDALRDFYCSCGCGDSAGSGGDGGGTGGNIGFVDEDGDGIDDRYNVTESELGQAIDLGGAYGQIEGFYNTAAKVQEFLVTTSPNQQQVEDYLNDIYDTNPAESTNFAASWVGNPVLIVTNAEDMTTELAHVDHCFCDGVDGGLAVRRESYKHDGTLTADQLALTRILTRVFSAAQYAAWDDQGRDRPRFKIEHMSCFVFKPFKIPLDNPTSANQFGQYVTTSQKSYPQRTNQGFIVTAEGTLTDSSGTRRDALFREATPGAGDWQFDPLREIEFQDGTGLGLTPPPDEIEFSESHKYAWSVECNMGGPALFKIDDMATDGLTGKIVLTVTHTGSEVES